MAEDGSLSQQEIDALLAGAGDDVTAKATGNENTLSVEMASALQAKIPTLKALLGRDIVLQEGVTEKADSTIIRSLYPGPVVAVTLTTPVTGKGSGNDAFILVKPEHAGIISQLMWGREPSEFKELTEAHTATLQEFASMLWRDLVPFPDRLKEVASMQNPAPVRVDILADVSTLPVAEVQYCIIPLIFIIERIDAPVRMDLVLDSTIVSSSSWKRPRPGMDVPADADPKAIAGGGNAGPKPAFPPLDDYPVPSDRISGKISAYLLGKGIRSSFMARFHAGKIFDELLSDFEKAMLSGNVRGLSHKEIRRRAIRSIAPMIREKIRNAGTMHLGTFSLGSNADILSRVPFLMSVRFAKDIVRFDDITTGKSRKLPGLEEHVGETGELMFADRVIGRARLLMDRHKKLFLEVNDPLLTDEADIFNLMLSLPVSLHMEVGRMTVPAGDIADLRAGSIIELDKLAGEPLDLVLTDNDTVIARGEAVIVNPNMGIRITEMSRQDDRKHGKGGEPSPAAVPKVCIRVILGSITLTVQDLMGLGEASIIEMDSLAGEPASVFIDHETFLPGEIVIIDENFGVRIIEPVTGFPCPGELSPEPSPEAAGQPAPEISPTPTERIGIADVAEFSRLVGKETVKIMSDGTPGAVMSEVLSAFDDDFPAVMKAFNKFHRFDPDGAASLLVCAGEDKASGVMRQLQGDALDTLSMNMGMAGDIYPSRRDEVFARFLAILRVSRSIPSGDPDYLHGVLKKALGEPGAADVINRITRSLIPRPFDWAERIEPIKLVTFLQNEHPQTIALVLSCLDSFRAAVIMSSLEHALQADVAHRIAVMGRVSSSTLQQVERDIRKKISSSDTSTIIPAGGIDALVELLNNVDRGTEKIIIEALEETDQELALEVKNRMFVFEDIVLLDDRSIQKVLREVDSQDLAKALKGVMAGVQEKIFRNMSKRASALLREDMDFMGPIRLADASESQQKIVNIIRKLEDSGDIIIARAGEDELIV